MFKNCCTSVLLHGSDISCGSHTFVGLGFILVWVYRFPREEISWCFISWVVTSIKCLRFWLCLCSVDLHLAMSSATPLCFSVHLKLINILTYIQTKWKSFEAVPSQMDLESCQCLTFVIKLYGPVSRLLIFGAMAVLELHLAVVGLDRLLLCYVCSHM